MKKNFFLLGLFFFLACFINEKGLPLSFASEQTPEEIYDRYLLAWNNGDALKDIDNSSGKLAWGESYVLDSLLEMYLATGEASYLERFVDHADSVLATRDDKKGVKDWKGDLRKGWGTNSQFTLGVPQIINDADGNPSLKIQTRAWAHNNLTQISIEEGSTSGTYKIKVTNERLSNYNREYDNLTQDTVESLVNQELSDPQTGRYGLIKVWRLGDKPPVYTPVFTPPTYWVVLHGHHTGVITWPMVRFATIVKNSNLLSDYLPKAEEYIKAVEESLFDFENIWVDKGSWGYYTFEKGIPFWADGAEEPYNTNAATGMAWFYLWRATGKEEYRIRAEKIGRLIKNGLLPHPNGNGSYYMFYSFGKFFNGWTTADDISINNPNFSGYKAYEDTSHSFIMVQLVTEFYKNSLVFDKQDIDALVKTFNLNLWQDLGENFLSNNLYGSPTEKSKSDHASGSWVVLSQFDPSIWEKVKKIYYAKFNKDMTSGAVLVGWARLARCAKIIKAESPPVSLDLNNDGQVDIEDVKLLLSSFFTANFDLNADSLVNGVDFARMRKEVE